LIVKEANSLHSRYEPKFTNAASVKPYGDGQACRRIVEAIEYAFCHRKQAPEPFIVPLARMCEFGNGAKSYGVLGNVRKYAKAILIRPSCCKGTVWFDPYCRIGCPDWWSDCLSQLPFLAMDVQRTVKNLLKKHKSFAFFR
jgi:hypothetical protein